MSKLRVAIFSVFVVFVFHFEASAQWLTEEGNYSGTNNQGYFVTVDRGGGGYHKFENHWNYFQEYFDLNRNNPGNSVNGLGWRYGWDGRQMKYILFDLWMDYGNASASDGKVIFGAYGWLRNTNARWSSSVVAEYYVVERWRAKNFNGQNLPYLIGSDETPKYGGTYTSNGSKYDVYRTKRTRKPSIIGEQTTFYQYWAIRRNQRGLGNTEHTIDMSKAFSKWRGKWSLPNWHDYQVIGIDAYAAKGGGAVLVPNAPRE